jgi:hypothetical protein
MAWLSIQLEYSDPECIRLSVLVRGLESRDFLVKCPAQTISDLHEGL